MHSFAAKHDFEENWIYYWHSSIPIGKANNSISKIGHTPLHETDVGCARTWQWVEQRQRATKNAQLALGPRIGITVDGQWSDSAAKCVQIDLQYVQNIIIPHDCTENEWRLSEIKWEENRNYDVSCRIACLSLFAMCGMPFAPFHRVDSIRNSNCVHWASPTSLSRSTLKNPWRPRINY